MTVTETEPTTRSLRRELHEFVAAKFKEEGEISSEKLIRQARDHFAEDPWMIDALIKEGLRAIIPRITGDVKHQRRTSARLSHNDNTRRARIASVFEHVGQGYSKSLLNMTRPDHLYAAEERSAAANGHLRWVGFHREVARLHKNDVTCTGQLPADRVDALFKKHIET